MVCTVSFICHENFLLGKHGARSVLMWLEGSCSMPMGFNACSNIFIHWIAVCFVSHAWCALFVFFLDRKILARGSWNFELV